MTTSSTQRRDESSKLICLWTVPRACSTAFERSVMNRTDMDEVYHEPLSIPYYFGPKNERGSERYADSKEERETYEQKLKEMTTSRQNAPDGKHVFSKDMAYYLAGPDGEIDGNLLQEVVDAFDVHTFLIKNPIRQVPSLHRMSTEQTETTGWTSFHPKEVGFKEIKILMDAVKEKEGKDPIVVDSDELLQNPKAVLEGYCEAIGLPFEEDRMLKWEAHDEAVEKKWADWKGWHDHALASTGFGTSNNGKRKTPIAPEARQVVDKAIAEAMPVYEEMIRFRVTSTPS